MTDWSKVGRSSRRKGHAFEREIAKKMNELLGSHFVRTPASGGHAIEGDLYEPPHERTAFSNITFYCRTGWEWNFEDLFNENANRGPLRWHTETGIDTMWVFRSSPGNFFVSLHHKRWSPKAGVEIRCCVKTLEFVIMPLRVFAYCYRKGFIILGKGVYAV